MASVRSRHGDLFMRKSPAGWAIPLSLSVAEAFAEKVGGKGGVSLSALGRNLEGLGLGASDVLPATSPRFTICAFLLTKAPFSPSVTCFVDWPGGAPYRIDCSSHVKNAYSQALLVFDTEMVLNCLGHTMCRVCTLGSCQDYTWRDDFARKYASIDRPPKM